MFLQDSNSVIYSLRARHMHLTARSVSHSEMVDHTNCQLIHTQLETRTRQTYMMSSAERSFTLVAGPPPAPPGLPPRFGCPPPLWGVRAANRFCWLKSETTTNSYIRMCVLKHSTR